MDGVPDWLVIAGIVAIPAVGGLLSIVGAFLVAHQGRGKPEGAGGRTVAIVLLSLFGLIMLFVALGLGACFGVLSSARF